MRLLHFRCVPAGGREVVYAQNYYQARYCVHVGESRQKLSIVVSKSAAKKVPSNVVSKPHRLDVQFRLCGFGYVTLKLGTCCRSKISRRAVTERLRMSSVPAAGPILRAARRALAFFEGHLHPLIPSQAVLRGLSRILMSSASALACPDDRPIFP